MNITYRPIQKKDNLAVKELIQNVFVEFDAPREGTVFADPEMEDLFGLFEKTPKSIFYVAEKEGEVLGCCGVYPTEGLPPNVAEMVKLYLSSGARGKGIGKTLMDKCMESAQAFGFGSLYIESIPEFENAVKLYERQGFVRLKKPLGDTGHFTCSIWMLKNLGLQS
ncbi:GNAT family N-acetyltransferase [Echinicola sp. CAU 1574]|uniref:GNAT family N-acetyltransferase n=1 Tax=Echinicola arenosa TaxID=2774144 RepID=A0ABR9AIH3_9BACT|nr:GNAT family N-acetyltransferase [Echinicola arenosa]MBD8488591.1 GNAT family N-acetyltransferase [Echinicola arenosa]